MSEKKKPEKADAPELRKVVWTEDGERRGAHSEHGTHKAGEIVETAHADLLIERGFAKAAA